MRKFVDGKISGTTSGLAALVLAVGIASLAAGQIIVFEPHGPVFLQNLGCVDPGDNVMRQALRALCDDLAEQRGFQTGVMQAPQASQISNSTAWLCPQGERAFICVGVGGGHCTTENCTIL